MLILELIYQFMKLNERRKRAVVELITILYICPWEILGLLNSYFQIEFYSHFE